VAVTPVPQAAILDFVSEELAREAGLDLEIVEFTDYVQPNVALDEGAVDAKYYQHGVFLADQEATAGYDFTGLATISFQPKGLCFETMTDLAQTPECATVAIPNDPVNGSRGLNLLAAEGLITLDDPDAPVPTALPSPATRATCSSRRWRPRSSHAASATSTFIEETYACTVVSARS
jgi:D-methionine transport system substrate-binding protein